MPAKKGTSTARCKCPALSTWTSPPARATLPSRLEARNQVIVHGSIHGNNSWFSNSEDAIHQVESNPPIQQNGNSIRIGYNLPDDVKRHVSISYEVTVPADAIVQAHSGSGGIGVEGVRGEVQAQTGSGDIRLRDLGGHVHVQTGSGGIRAQDVAAPFYGHTGSGDIEAELNGSGDVDIQTGSGSVHLRGVKGGLRARTGSGDISADGSVTGGWQLHTGSGSVKLAVGSGERIQSGCPHRLRVDSFRSADYGAGLAGQARTEGQRKGRRTGSGSLHRLGRRGNTLAARPVLQRILGLLLS